MQSSSTLDNLLPVRGACFAQISFGIDAPSKAALLVEHLNEGQLLARESRPLSSDASDLEVKILPDASHIACSLQAGDRVVNGAQFSVDCGDTIEPVGRHFIILAP